MDETEVRKCSACGEEWTDTGDLACPFCDSDDTYVVNHYWSKDETTKRDKARVKRKSRKKGD